jgi:two-component system LytT family response regulator
LKKLRAIVIDDEANARDVLTGLLELYCPTIEVVSSAEDVPAGVIEINKHSPDVVFLDIEMPKYNGLDILKFFKTVDFEIIFVTAYSEYAIQAFEVSAIDYLLKPVQIEQLEKAVAKLTGRNDDPSRNNRFSALQSNFTSDELQKIALPVSDGLIFIELEDVIFFEAEGAYTRVFCKDKSPLLISKKLKRFEELLENSAFFYRIHRSALIHLKCVTRYNRQENTVEMTNGQHLRVARDRKQAFEEIWGGLRIT